ncbi:apolipoprotein N-acyltransferase [Leptolyngbya sp. PCC 6406]|uniref:apolipoprotein N-acyltransferase n=1 Tax=Leptolyngbya sp. PCC 6406 TaxID=1173264 RepID=UPI0002AB9AE0|nr:apolipoprotein N-acyltransferase [Leptolyngbya sp. PCC 6406]
MVVQSALNRPHLPRSWRSPLTVILGGIAMGLCPAPVNVWPLAWVALVPLWLTVANPSKFTSPGWAFRQGLWWSLTYHGIVLSWITALHPLMWLGVPWLGSIAIAAFAWSFITLLGGVTFGAWAGLMHWAGARWSLNALQRLVLGTALWCALETLLSWGPLYWPSLSYTQSPTNSWILHLGQLSGPMTVTAAIVLVNGCWAEAWMAQRRGRSIGSPAHPARRPLSPWAGIGLGLWLGFHSLGAGLMSLAPADSAEQGLTLGLIQGNVPTRIKLTPEGMRRASRGYAEGYRALVAQGAEAVLTPEGAIPEVWLDHTQRQSPIYQAVAELGRVLWLGTFRPVETPLGRSLTQSLVTLDGNAQVISQYDKVKLVPLGEYIPFPAVLGRIISRLSPLEGSLYPGALPTGLETPFGRAIVGICYESAYSDLFRRQAVRGGEWIMTASNNDPYPPRMMLQHHAQDVMRAIETDRWALRVTNTGISGVVTPRGETRWLAPHHEYVTHLEQIYRRRTQTLYVRWGDWLTPLLLGLAAISLFTRPIYPPISPLHSQSRE